MEGSGSLRTLATLALWRAAINHCPISGLDILNKKIVFSLPCFELQIVHPLA